MKIQYKKFNGEDFVLMEELTTKEAAIQRAAVLRPKYGKTRVAKMKTGNYGVYCQQ